MEDYVAEDMKNLAKSLNIEICNLIQKNFEDKNMSQTFLKGLYFIITFENPDKSTDENATLVSTNLWAKDNNERNLLMQETLKRFSGK